jgi:UDP-GlcNAc:undecaprenyl-phosphate GlcNAc-1-phosphate transferase
MLGGLVAAYVVARELPFLSTSSPFVFRDAGIVLIAGALICAVGVLDDLFELDALTKLGGQVLAAGFLVAFGIQYIFFPQTNGIQFSLDSGQGALLTGFVVVATVNAVNFVDGPPASWGSGRSPSSYSPTSSPATTGSRWRPPGLC